MPFIGWLTGGTNFSRFFILLGKIPPTYKGSPADYAALKAAGVPMIGYGEFITTAVDFVFLAWIIFMIVKAANKIEKPKEEAPAAPAGPSEVDLLTEIRDALKKGG